MKQAIRHLLPKRRLPLVVGGLLIIAGMIALAGYYRALQNTQVVPGPASASHQLVANKPSVIQGEPSELILPNLNLNLQVIPGIYNPKTKQWTLSLDKVQYAVMTAPPNNDNGQTFIYGHYRRGVLATLHTSHIGDLAIIKTDNGHTFYYQLASIRVTNPNDSSVFNYQGKPILTIQTCTGEFFQNRQLFTYNLVRVV